MGGSARRCHHEGALSGDGPPMAELGGDCRATASPISWSRHREIQPIGLVPIGLKQAGVTISAGFRPNSRRLQYTDLAVRNVDSGNSLQQALTNLGTTYTVNYAAQHAGSVSCSYGCSFML